MRTIWLHIGMRKAGSTAIQDFLCKNQKRMLELGYDYPTDFSPHAQRSLALGIKGLPQCGNLNHIITNAFNPQPETLAQMVGQLKTPKDKDIILSSENLYFLTHNTKLLQALKDLLLAKTKNHKIKVIGYLRRQDEILESMYRQDIQDINYKDFKFKEEYLDDPDTQISLNLRKFVDVFADFFGKENIHIKPFEKEQLKDNDVVSDFLDEIGVKDLEGLNLKQESNVTFSHEIVEYLRLSKEFIPPLHKRLTNCFTLINQKVRSKPISMVPPNIKRKIALEYKEMNDKIAKDYLNRDELFLKPIPEKDDNWKPYQMTADDAVKVSSLLFQDLFVQLSETKDEVAKIKSSMKLLLQFLQEQEQKSQNEEHA